MKIYVNDSVRTNSSTWRLQGISYRLERSIPRKTNITHSDESSAEDNFCKREIDSFEGAGFVCTFFVALECIECLVKKKLRNYVKNEMSLLNEKIRTFPNDFMGTKKNCHKFLFIK